MNMNVFFVDSTDAIPLSAVTEISVNSRTEYTTVVLRTAGDNQRFTLSLGDNFNRTEVLMAISDYSYHTGFLEVSEKDLEDMLVANRGSAIAG